MCAHFSFLPGVILSYLNHVTITLTGFYELCYFCGMKDFDISRLSEDTAAALAEMNIYDLNSLQCSAVPHLLSGADTVVISPSGTGKTLTFLIPVSERIELQGKGKHFPAYLILVPTRELAIQTASVCRSLFSKREGVRTAVLCGGENIQNQIRRYARGADIVIGTPSRVLDHIRRHTLKLKKCTCLIVDEADEMMKMGFVSDTADAAAALPAHQTVFLSATLDPETAEFSRLLVNDPVFCQNVPDEKDTYPDLYYVISPENRKLSTLKGILRRFEGPAFIFCAKKVTADFTASALQNGGFRTAVIHSDMDMSVRKKAMTDFRNGKLDAVCSTDVLARGIDVPDIPLCIHYDFPPDKETMIHRSGRTARAGRSGNCVFILKPREKANTAVIRKTFRKEVRPL